MTTEKDKVSNDKTAEEIADFVTSELCDYDDESGRYFREDSIIRLIEVYSAQQLKEYREKLINSLESEVLYSKYHLVNLINQTDIK